VIIHELFEHFLVEKAGVVNNDAIRIAFNNIIKKKIEDIYVLQLTEEDVYKEISGVFPILIDWITKFICSLLILYKYVDK